MVLDKISLTLLIGICLLLQACGDVFDLSDAELAPNQADYAVPIINSKANLQDILEATDEQVRFSVQADGTIELIYDSDALTITASEILLPVPVLIDIPLQDSISTLSFSVIDGFRGERAIFKNNSLRFKAFVPDSDEYEVNIRIPKFQQDGEDFEYTFTIPQNSFGQEVESDFIDLTGIELLARFDEIDVIYDARNSLNERVILPGLFARLDFLIFSYLEGSFGRQVFDIPSGQIPFNTFRNYISGQINFDEPRLLIKVDNSLGLPIEPRINNLSVITRTTLNLPLTSPLFFPGNLLFDYPRLDEIGASKQTTIVLNKDNSNIISILDEQTTSIFFDIDAIAFPDNDQETIGFIRDDGRIDIKSELILPVKGTVESYVLFDDYPINSLEIENAEELEFNLGVENGLPLGVKFQIHFLTPFYGVIDSLFPAPIEIPSASLNTDGTIDEISEFITTELLSNSKLNKIEPSGFIRAYIALFQPADRTESIAITAENTVGIKLGARVKLNQ